jgi:hypothetical protein
MSKKNKKINTNGGLSSMSAVRISESEDGSVVLTILNDKSHGYRTFIFSSKDWEAFKHLIED